MELFINHTIFVGEKTDRKTVGKTLGQIVETYSFTLDISTVDRGAVFGRKKVFDRFL